MNESQRKMLLDWLRKVHQLEYAHRYESLDWARLSRPVEIAALSIATVVAFSYQFPTVTLEEHASLPAIVRHEVFVPLASLAVALLTAVSTLLRPCDKADFHRSIGAAYEALRHDLEAIITRNPRADDIPEALAPWKARWDGMEAPNVSQRNFRKGKERAYSLNKYPEELSFLEDLDDEG